VLKLLALPAARRMAWILALWLPAVAVAHAGSAALQDPGGQHELKGDNKRFGDSVGSRSMDSPGARTFAARCAACHVAGADPHAPHRDMLQLMTGHSILWALTEGPMRQQGASLGDDERRQVAEYLAGRPLGTEAVDPSPPRCTGKASEFDFNEPPPWSGWGIDQANTHFVPEKVAGIGRGNIGQLRLKWAFALPDANRVRSQVMPAGGALYVGSQNGSVFALDRASGCVRWMFRAASEVRTGIVVGGWRAGDTAAHPLAYFGDLLGNVYAIDARVGRLIWRVRPDSNPGATITATPALLGKNLFVSLSSLEGVSAADPNYACCRFRGSVRSLDAVTGKQTWVTYTILTEPKVVGKNSAGTDILAPAGAPVWNTPAIDEKRGLLFFGDGDNLTSPSTATSDAVFAVSLKTGEIKWVYQGLAGDAFNGSCFVVDRINCPSENGPDLDFGAAVIYLADAAPGGLVLAGQKSGLVHAIDPDTGKLVWKTRVARGGVVGGILFGMATSRGRIYVPITDTPDGKAYPDKPRPGLYALNVRDGQPLWAAPANDRCEGRAMCYPGLSQAITASGDFVFAGSIDGWIRAHDALDGRTLWEADTNQPVKTVSGVVAHGGSMGGGAAPIPYRGMLFVSSGYAFAGLSAGNVILAYTTTAR
jgi:polyvinyl alcohol dehydrogenase (cytochrome)